MKYKYLFFGICIILLLPSIYAFEFDNVKSYNEEDKIATITNAFGLGDKIADITLLDNTYHCLEKCEANIKLDLKKNYKEPFEELYFIPNIKSYKLLLRDEGYSCDVDVHKTICTQTNSLDPAHKDECVDTIVGTKKDICYSWNEFDQKKDLNKGVYYIKIKGIKERNSNVEWIPQFMGEEIEEWASWDGTYNLGLVSYWGFNNSILNVPANYTVDSLGNWNLSINATHANITATGCKEGFGNCSQFNGTTFGTGKYGSFYNGEGFNTSALNLCNGSNFTVSVWVNVSSTTNNDGGGNIILGANYRSWEIGISEDYNYSVVNVNGISFVINDTSIRDSKWHMISFSYNSSSTGYGSIKGYLDGFNNANGSGFNSVCSTNVVYNFTVGTRSGENEDDSKFDGQVDELSIWNRSLSSQEIYDLYINNFTYDNSSLPTPTHINPILNTTLRTNLTSENLTCWNQSTNGYGDDVKNIYSWYKDNYTIEQLNLPFEGNGGGESTSTNDFSSNNNSMEVTGALWNSTRGYDGFGAYKFNGTTDWIDTTNTTIFDGVENFTISAWFNSSEDNYQYIINKLLVLGIRIVDDDTLQMIMYNETAQMITVSFDPTGGSILNNWHHFVMRYDSVNANLTGWFDGEKKVDVFAQGGLKTSNNKVRIGARGNEDHPFNGTIDDVRVYYEALNPEQIKFLWENKTHFLSSSETTSDEVYKCNVAPINENGEGSRLNSTGLLILENKIPIINNVTIHPNQTSISYGNSVNCSANIDVDNSVSSLYFSWYKQNNLTTHLIDGTQLYLPFESESNATYTKDYSNYDYNGTVKGASYLSTGGYDGFGAYNFTGNRINYINAGNSTRYNSTEGTISTWVYAVNDQQQYVYASRGTNGDHIQSIWHAVSNKTHFTILADGSTYNLITSELEVNKWYHVVTSWGSGGMELYVNGVLNASNVYTGSWDGNYDFRVGNSERYPSNGWNGTLDEFQIYDRQLSVTEILAIYNTGLIHQKIDNVVDGTYFAAYNLTLPYQNIGGNYTCGIIINDQFNPIQYANSTTFYINSTLWNTSLYPSTEVNTTNDINGSSKYIGTNLVNLTFNWYKDSRVIDITTYINIVYNSYISNVLNSNLFIKGENITLEIISNFSGTIETLNSSTIQIVNSPPTPPSTLSPLNNTVSASTSMAIGCSGSSDPDGDTINYEFWNVSNGYATQSILQNTTSTDYTWSGLGNGTYKWRCRSNDGYITSEEYNETRQFEILNISLGVCNMGSANETLNVTLWDEKNMTALNGTLEGNLVYYLENDPNGISGNKTLYFNIANNHTFSFCMNPFTHNISANATFNYLSTSYPQRQTKINIPLANTTINQTLLYLLSSADGSYTTFQVVNPATQPIDYVYITEEKLMSGVWTLVEQKYTDSSGGATFWVDYNSQYRYTFEKEGYTTYSTTITPTQSSYTITLTTSYLANKSVNYYQGITYLIYPFNSSLNNNTDQNFTFQVNSSYWSLQDVGFIIRNQSNNIFGSVNCDTSEISCTTSLINNTGNNTNMIMDWYWKINDTYVNGSHSWYITETYIGNYSLFNIVRTDIENLGAGFSDFTKAIICLIIIMIVIAGLGFYSGTYSPVAIVWLVFGIMLLLEMIGLAPTLVGAIPYFISIILGLVAVAYTIWEYRW